MVTVPQEEADALAGGSRVPGEGLTLGSEGTGVLTLTYTQRVSHLANDTGDNPPSPPTQPRWCSAP